MSLLPADSFFSYSSSGSSLDRGAVVPPYSTPAESRQPTGSRAANTEAPAAESVHWLGSQDRRQVPPADSSTPPGVAERRQFGSSHAGLSEPGRELAAAIDRYKIQRHRRYITCDEMLAVLATLGYAKVDAAS